VSDSVVVDAKRILLRYGVPIGLMDEIREADRIAFARAVSRTPVPDRGERLLGLLVEHGYLDAVTAEASLKKLKKARKKAKK
jgi:CBS domain-containing protein